MIFHTRTMTVAARYMKSLMVQTSGRLAFESWEDGCAAFELKSGGLREDENRLS